MKRRGLILLLCSVLAMGFPMAAQARNRTEGKTGMVTIQYMDMTSAKGRTRPIEGAEFSFYSLDREKRPLHKSPYVTEKTDAEGVLTAILPEGTYKVCQDKNGVAYHTSDFCLTIPMKNEQGVLTENIEAFPKAEPLRVESQGKKSGTLPAATPLKKTSGQKRSPMAPKKRTSKAQKVKTGDNLLRFTSVAVMASAAGLGMAMAIRKKRKEEGGDEG